jgi:hypothetical protein
MGERGVGVSCAMCRGRPYREDSTRARVNGVDR